MAESEAAASKKTEEEEVEEELYEVVGTLQELELEKAHISDIPTPKVSVVSVGPDVVSFAVEPHSSLQTFDLVVDYCAAEQKGSVVHKDCPHVDIQGLCPGTEYMFTITRRLHSSQTCLRVATAPIPPPPLSVTDTRTDSVSLSWEPPAGQVKNYTVSCCSGEEMIQELQTEATSVTISDLRPTQQYVFSVCAQLQNGHKSEPARISAGTKPLPPAAFTVTDIRTDSVSLSWEPPAGEVKNYTVSCCSEEEMIQELQTEETRVTISDLRPAQQYVFSVCAQLQNGHKSEPARISAGTNLCKQVLTGKQEHREFPSGAVHLWTLSDNRTIDEFGEKWEVGNWSIVVGNVMGFLSIGVIAAIFSVNGSEPVDSELIMEVMSGEREQANTL
ncbi:hypothetical protein WMY93_030678 [Mugilogobius chulae]|uniref:Fibronectin type-III domain-containing protein n=1 Tax=Mugilogobius chulae TaxID=88201 RepID=A0AAW0MKC8_9GOBI